jgi:hypothetical protein
VSTQKRQKARKRPPLRLAGDPGDDITRIIGDLPPWDGFSATIGPSDTDTIWYSSPAATAETAPMPAAEDTRPLPAQPAAGPGRTPLYDETIQGWGHIGVIYCAGQCITAFQDPAAPSYRALYEAAWQAGWRRDAHGRDYCGRCAQLDGRFRSPAQVTAWAYTDLQLRDRTLSHWAASHARASAHRKQVSR